MSCRNMQEKIKKQTQKFLSVLIFKFIHFICFPAHHLQISFNFIICLIDEIKADLQSKPLILNVIFNWFKDEIFKSIVINRLELFDLNKCYFH